MFSLNEKIVYPGHGVAKITRIIHRNVTGKKISFFELTFLNKDMTILVPVDNMITVGVRKLSSPKIIDHILKLLATPVVSTTIDESLATNWNKRQKDYYLRIRSGDLEKICEIYRDLKHIASKKELSFGEKSLLLETESLLVEEIALVSGTKEEKATEQLRSALSRVYSQNKSSEMAKNI